MSPMNYGLAPVIALLTIFISVRLRRVKLVVSWSCSAALSPFLSHQKGESCDSAYFLYRQHQEQRRFRMCRVTRNSGTLQRLQKTFRPICSDGSNTTPDDVWLQNYSAQFRSAQSEKKNYLCSWKKKTEIFREYAFLRKAANQYFQVLRI